jgi:hypothetical protein
VNWVVITLLTSSVLMLPFRLCAGNAASELTGAAMPPQPAGMPPVALNGVRVNGWNYWFCRMLVKATVPM